MNATSIASSSFEFQSTTEVPTYINRMISFLGVILNSLGLVIMMNKTLIHPMYNFTWGRTFCNWLVCLLGCGWVKTLNYDQPGTYYQKVYQAYIFGLPSRIVFCASSISDLMLILNRYFVITERKVWLLKISKLTNLAICYVLSICIWLPGYFSYNVDRVGSDEKFTVKLTNFGQTSMFQGYASGLFLLETVLGVCILGVFNVLSAIRFRKNMIRKGHLLRNRTNTKRKEVMYTKMVFILTTICFITRLLDAVTGTFARSMALNFFEFEDETKYRITLCYEISWTLLLAAHAFDNWVYFLMDPNLRRCTRELFCRPTTQTTIVSCTCFNQSLLNFKLLFIHQSFRRSCQCSCFHRG
jgi:hypothetical protein